MSLSVEELLYPPKRRMELLSGLKTEEERYEAKNEYGDNKSKRQCYNHIIITSNEQ